MVGRFTITSSTCTLTLLSGSGVLGGLSAWATMDESAAAGGWGEWEGEGLTAHFLLIVSSLCSLPPPPADLPPPVLVVHLVVASPNTHVEINIHKEHCDLISFTVSSSYILNSLPHHLCSTIFCQHLSARNRVLKMTFCSKVPR